MHVKLLCLGSVIESGSSSKRNRIADRYCNFNAIFNSPTAVDHPGHADADLVGAVAFYDLEIAHLDFALLDFDIGRNHRRREHHRDIVARIELAGDLPACRGGASPLRALLGGTRVPRSHAGFDVHVFKGRGDVGQRNAERREVVHRFPEQPDPALHLVAHLAEIDVHVGPAEELMQGGVGMQGIVEQLAGFVVRGATGERHEVLASRFGQGVLHASEGDQQGLRCGHVVFLIREGGLLAVVD